MGLFRLKVGQYVVLSPPKSDPHSMEFPPNARYLSNQQQGVGIVQADVKRLLETDESEITGAVTPLVNLLLSAFGMVDVFEPGRPVVENAASLGHALAVVENADPRAREGLSEPHYATARFMWMCQLFKSALDSVGSPFCYIADYAFDAAYWCSRSGADPMTLKDGFLQFVSAVDEAEATAGRAST